VSRKSILAMLLVVVMVSSVMSQIATAKKPARMSLIVGMAEPVDGLVVENGASFTVSGTVESRNGRSFRPVLPWGRHL
jgi:hypothetical protein